MVLSLPPCIHLSLSSQKPESTTNSQPDFGFKLSVGDGRHAELLYVSQVSWGWLKRSDGDSAPGMVKRLVQYGL